MNTNTHLFCCLLVTGALALGIFAAPTEAQTLPQNVSRAQAITSLLLTRTPDLPPFDRRRVFADIPDNKWYAPYMRAAERYGIIQTDANGRLHPEDDVTRAEFLKMLALTFDLPLDQPHLYADIPQGAWFAPYAGIAHLFDLFEQSSNPYLLQPAKLLTQSEASYALEQVLAYRAQQRTQEEKDRKREQEEAAKEAAGQLQLYTIISTRQQKVRFVRESAPPTTEAPSEPIPARDSKDQRIIAGLRIDMMNLVNTARVLSGQRPLKYNILLERSAQAYAEDMAARGFFSHVSPEGETLEDRVRKAGYRDRRYTADCFCVKGYTLAENLARGQRTPQGAMNAWMQSPPHRAAILGSEYKDVGFGIAAGYWVIHFGAVIVPVGGMAEGK